MPDIGNSNISSGRSETFEFTDTAPSDADTVEVTFEASLPNGTASTVTRTIDVLSLSDVVSITDYTFSGTQAGSRTIDGTVTVQNDDSEQQSVTLTSEGTQLASSDIYSGRERDLDFEYTLPNVDQRTTVDIPVEVNVGGEVVATSTKSIEVKPISDYISLDSVNLPDTASSGETLDSFDNTVTVTSDLGDTTVSLQVDGSEVGSNEFFSSGSNDVRVELQMPEVANEQAVSFTINGFVGGQSVGSISKTITVLGPAAQVSIDSVESVSTAYSGDTAEVTVGVSNSADQSQTIDIEYDGSQVASGSVSSGRSSDLSFGVSLPEVESEQTVQIDVQAVVGDIVADSGRTTISVRNLGNDITIRDSSLPNRLLSGEQAEGSVTMFNDTDRSVNVDLSVDGSVDTSKEVSPGGTTTIRYQYQAPDVDDSQDVTVDVDAIVGGDTVASVDKTVTVSHRKKFISITDVQLPNSIVGGKSGEGKVVLSNSNEETIQANVEHDGNLVSSNPKNVRQSVDATFTFIFDTSEVTQETQQEVSALALVDGDVADSDSSIVSVLPPEEEENEDDGDGGGKVVDNHIKIDTEQGEITVKSGYNDSVTVSGSVAGRDVSLTGPAETQRLLGVLPGRFGDVFNGEIPAESQNEIATFASIRYIKLETSRPFVFSVDGEKKGQGKAYTETFR